ncbi:ABC transporter ATP-binding protein [Promicromonospora citrea]|uniref:ABC transporter ATP-binding protein n=1 Tax=Promicromonospora citrea TaxID=43677 RepID=A0A8H9GKE0_9MICO|nr:ATP-binding cassette domain-containing protein [Promicromonospora citrea]NNH53241.1 ATP-binding cassette domain-containing protein [Promicromonospora citrea]GGM34761.1 ABC transporter ATP-binding protein [Promicromonospora citrea]HEV6951620.1 ATP-binding cassette domain-containing protein [Promicromonospora sp.]
MTTTGSTADGPPRLEVAGLTVTFGGLTALDDVGFTVADGETVALIGPNGAGKTTVFNAVCGLVRTRRGEVRVGGEPAPPSATGLLRAGVSRTLQGLGLFDRLTVLENVLVPLSGTRLTGDHLAAAHEVLAALGLGAVAAVRAGALPYPERKRVALARALVTRPRLLLLDEPAGGLGAADIDQLARTVRTVADGGCAVLLVEHHVDFVTDVADRVVVLDLGRVIACGTPGEVRRDPAVEEAYLGVPAGEVRP